MRYKIEFELPDNDTVLKEIKHASVGWQIWGYSGIAKPVPSIDAEPQWIPCSERLPEAYQPVLRTVKRLCWDEGTGFGTWLDVDIGTYNTNDGNIVAWMPLPKPYEERKES